MITESLMVAAVNAELDKPVRLLPRSSVSPALTDRRPEVAAWAGDRLQGTFFPTGEETVAVSKAGHGVRPVAVWDLPSRLAYTALTDKLRPSLPSVERSRAAWRAFQRAPLDLPGEYVVGSDIASCYQYLDHALLAEELLVQTGEHEVVETVTALLRGTGGRSYGLPQQSDASDLLAEAFLLRLERALVRRGLQVGRYNDDLRFTCATWSEATRAIEVLAEEARLIGLTVNDLKTVTWKRKTYEDHLAQADCLREEIAREAQIDLTKFDEGPYGTVTPQPPATGDVDLHQSVLVLERWSAIAGEGDVDLSRRAEHRAVLELVPTAFKALGLQKESPNGVLDICTGMLRYERTLTPSVADFLGSREDKDEVLAAFDRLLKDNVYLNGWQTWWLQEPVARLVGFASGTGAGERMAWQRSAFASAEHTPVLRVHAALALARHGKITVDDLLAIFHRSSATVRPVLAAAVAHLQPTDIQRDAVTGDSPLCAWTFEWAASGA